MCKQNYLFTFEILPFTGLIQLTNWNCKNLLYLKMYDVLILNTEKAHTVVFESLKTNSD